MLVLSRRRGEAIRIGESVTVRIVRVKGRTVSLGIDAPQDVKIVRTELDVFGKCPSCCCLHSHGIGNLCPMCKEANGDS